MSKFRVTRRVLGRELSEGLRLAEGVASFVSVVGITLVLFLWLGLVGMSIVGARSNWWLVLGPLMMCVVVLPEIFVAMQQEEGWRVAVAREWPWLMRVFDVLKVARDIVAIVAIFGLAREIATHDEGAALGTIAGYFRRLLIGV